MSSLRPESHVAQQIRRDKLRIQNNSQHLEDFPNNIEQLSLHPGLNSDLLQVRNVRNANMLYESAFFPSEMVNFSTASDPLSAAHRNTMECQDLVAAGPSTSRLMMPQYVSFPHASDPSSSIHSSPTQQCEPRNLGYDWMVNYGNSSVVNESNPNSNFAAQLDINESAAYQHLVKPSYNELREIQGSLSNPSGETHHAAPPLYQNTLQDIVKSASIMQQTGHGIWMGNGNESDQLLFGNAHLWTNRTSENFHGWNSPLSFSVKKSEEDSGPVLSDSNPQGLSLSLSSSAPPKLCNFQFGEGCGSDELHSKSMKSSLKPSLQDLVGIPSNTGYRNVGPLGPFTGYATILKSSRFLRPAQELLDEFCSLSGPNIFKACEVSDRLSREVSASTSAEAINGTESGVSSKDSNAGAALSSIFFSPKENSGDGARGSFSFSSPPEYQQKKAKLLYMQEEVIRRYKQYHQQMQMVFSSFESVVGLSSATPYITMALKSVSRHFRCLKNAILDQIKHIREVLGEDLAGSTSGTSSKLNTNMARLRCLDQSLQNNKSGGGDTGVWRHQRGLPERSVAILKAWLFEHFLHPYPTDTDKHMLATQTGLSRNQVSNWFINARVRVWKPMVEEIHMLETRGSTGANQKSGKNGAEGSSQAVVDQPRNMFGKHANAMPEKQFQCLEMGSEGEHWNQEKRSKLECESTSNMDGTLMGFVPYRRGGVGLGSVSLTLGLRHGVDGVQHQQQQLQQEEQLRRHFGEHMIHDFVG